MLSISSRGTASRLAPLAAGLGFLLACAGGGGDGKPTGGRIRTAWDVASIEPGETLVIPVAAVDAEGKAVTFTASAEGECASTTASPDAITVVAGDGICEQRIVLTSSTNVTKEVTVNVFDPMVMDIGDGLLIRYVNDYVWQWNDSESEGTYYISYWHPVAGGDGWFPLGSIAWNTWGNPSPTVPMVVAKDSGGTGALAAPIDYAYIYDDSGSGGRYDGSMWKPVCPAGYVALGAVTNSGYGKPPLDAVRCVEASYTTPGTIGAWLYDDRNTGATDYLSLWEIGYPDFTSSPDGRAALHAGTTLGCPGWQKTSCDLAIVNLLLVPVPVMTNGDATDLEPRLTGYQELDVSTARYFSSVRVPFTLIRNQAPVTAPDRVDWNVHASPFYTLQREEVYTPIDVIDHRQGTVEAVYTYSITTGISETDASSFSQEVGLEITAGGSASFLGSGGSWEVKLTTKLGWEQSTSSTYATSTTREYEFRIPPGRYAEIIQVTTQFRAVSWPGFTFCDPLRGSSNIIKYLQYPP
jgi:hypothetical protein